MSQKNLCVYGKNGKRLGGGAAQLKRIKDCGWWDAYHKELIGRVTEKVYEEIMDEMNRPKFRRVKWFSILLMLIKTD